MCLLAPAQKGFAEVEWQKTRWTEAHLVHHCGFRRTDEATMLVVAVAGGADQRQRYAVKYVYMPTDEESPEMR